MKSCLMKGDNFFNLYSYLTNTNQSNNPLTKCSKREGVRMLRSRFDEFYQTYKNDVLQVKKTKLFARTYKLMGIFLFILEYLMVGWNKDISTVLRKTNHLGVSHDHISEKDLRKIDFNALEFNWNYNLDDFDETNLIMIPDINNFQPIKEIPIRRSRKKTIKILLESSEESLLII